MFDDIGHHTGAGDKVQRRGKIAAGGDAGETQRRPEGILSSYGDRRAISKPKCINPTGNFARPFRRFGPADGVASVR